ncbi:hypothetical protein BDY24DRAFT_377349 [Mrakia frigida]|uniref:OB fold domain-containing protein n=1 Tax=Mrakia frigida TaxID=29902 RepID=UPI003FCC00E2
MDSTLTPILNNLKHLYPSPQFNNEWLQTTLTSILAQSPLLNRQQQIKASHERLLLSDLASSTVEGTGFPPELFADPEDPMHQKILFEGVRKGCLVMVVSITEIGSSAFTLQRTLHDRQEARTGVAKIRRLVGEEEADDDEEGQEGPKYARGTLKLELSDGFRTVRAIEYKRISSLKLGETRLGSKLLIQNVKVLRGLLLLTPETCSFKGQHVEELCLDGREEKLLESGFKERLGKEDHDDDEAPLPPSPPRRIVPPPAALRVQPPPPPPARNQPRPPQPFDPNDEDEEDYIPEDFQVEPAHAPPPAQARLPPIEAEEEEDYWAHLMDEDLEEEFDRDKEEQEEEEVLMREYEQEQEHRPPPKKTKKEEGNASSSSTSSRFFPPPAQPPKLRPPPPPPASKRHPREEEQETIVLGSSSDIEVDENPRPAKESQTQSGRNCGKTVNSSGSGSGAGAWGSLGGSRSGSVGGGGSGSGTTKGKGKEKVEREIQQEIIEISDSD